MYWQLSRGIDDVVHVLHAEQLLTCIPHIAFFKTKQLEVFAIGGCADASYFSAKLTIAHTAQYLILQTSKCLLDEFVVCYPTFHMYLP